MENNFWLNLSIVHDFKILAILRFNIFTKKVLIKECKKVQLKGTFYNSYDMMKTLQKLKITRDWPNGLR